MRFLLETYWTDIISSEINCGIANSTEQFKLVEYIKEVQTKVRRMGP